ncbi:MAG: hypothetical protein A2958_00785 [Candidatus Levybacteria bacterium RIFCSPLOWO2_01_FULL_38_13]|nr:MAG: hypothetical protein A2629_00680 [Candidatus Levybacteria bacterium RIFCSPHIGHO2_01_FULL_41_15]OGH34823.1 MAG: hypothetical protein A2958_00785 [Candidatus Levybacteria bacterium RIFCSPLOWO2_01_FULL_38_13]
MKDYARIFSFLNFPIAKVLRLFVFLLLFFLIISEESSLFVFFLSLLLIFEVFLRFKISKISPKLEVSKNDGLPAGRQGKNIFDSFTLPALALFQTSKDSETLIKKMVKMEAVDFIMEKSDILKPEEIIDIKISKDQIVKTAFETVKKLNGKFITTADLFASYLLLSESATKLLFNKGLKKEEFMQILLWTRARFSKEENPKPFRIEFPGLGIAEDWVTGWTIEARKYMLDLTGEILRKKPTILGREEEFRQLLEAMYKGKSALLVGEEGSGRREIASALSFYSLIGDLKGNLYHQKFYQLLVDALLAGTENIGALEARIDSLIAEVSHSGNIIIFIPSVENILGSSSFQLDLSGVLTPYIEKGAIRIICTISPQAYKKFVETRKTFAENFEIIRVDEPDSNTALNMLFRKSDEIEEKSKTSLSYKSIVASLKFAKKYLPDKVLPGSAAVLLSDTTAAVVLSGRKVVEEKDVIAKVEEKTNIAVGKPSGKEKQLLLNLEDKIHQRVIDQKEAVSQISEAMRRLRAGLTTEERPISFLFLGPTGVGKTETAKVLARLYFGGENKMIRLDMSEYSNQGSLKRLLGSLPGETETPGELTDKIKDNPFSLVLLDEFEKADPNILNLFLQVLEDGRLTDNKGKTVSFIDSIVIATSNAGSEFIREEVEKGTPVDNKFQKNLLELLQKKGTFKPELLNRFDGIIVFKPLSEDEVRKVTEILLSELSNKLKEQDISASFDNLVIEKVIKEGFDRQYGARPIRRYIEDNIEDLIAQKILKDEIRRGDKLQLTVNNPQLTVAISNS